MSQLLDVQIIQLPAMFRDTHTLQTGAADESVLMEAQKFCADLKGVSFECLQAQDRVTVCLTGPKKEVNEARGLISKRFTQIETCTLNIGARLILDQGLKILQPVEQFLNGLSDVSVIVRVPNSVRLNSQIKVINGVGEVELVLRGPFQALWQARVDCLTYFDRLAGRFLEHVEVQSVQVPQVTGRYKNLIQNVINSTGVAIYTPCVWSSNTPQSISISGQSDQQVQKATKQVRDLLNIRNQIQKKLTFSKAKCSIMQQFRQNELARIMADFACQIEVLDDGVQFTARMNGQVYAAMKAVIALCAKLYTVKLLCARDVRAAVGDIKTTTFTNICKRTGVVLSNHGDVMEVTGTAQQIQDMLPAFREVNEIQKVFREIYIFSQMALEYFDFITGKKNGKIIKIEKTSNVVIDIDNEDANFLTLNIHSTDFKRVIQGFGLYLDELPAEFEFHVPDHHHKRIIGAGGKNIQVVMKLYGVYVKFRGQDDYGTLGGYFPEDKNVLARTPAKNTHGLQKLYMAVMEMYIPSYRSHIEMVLQVPRLSHSLFTFDMIDQLEEKYSMQITVSDSTSGLDKVVFKGMPDALVVVRGEIEKLITVVVESEIQLDVVEGVVPKQVGTKWAYQATLQQLKLILDQAPFQKLAEVKDGYVLHQVIQQVKPQLHVLTTPLRQTPLSNEKSLLRSAIESSALARSVTIAHPVLSAGLNKSMSQATLSKSDKTDLRLKISSGQLNTSFGNKAPMTARTPNESFRRPPGLKIETSAPLFSGPASAPALEQSIDNKLMQSIVRNIMVVDPSNKLNNLFDMLELQKYKQSMADHEVDFEMFLKLQEEDFKELGFPLGPRKKLVAAISEIKLRRQLESKTPGIQSQRFQFSMTPPHSPMRSMFEINRIPYANSQPGPLSPSTQLGFVDFMPGTPIESPSKAFPPSFPSSPNRASPLVSPSKSMDGKLNAIGSQRFGSQDLLRSQK